MRKGLFGAVLTATAVALPAAPASANHTCQDNSRIPPIYQCSHEPPAASFTWSPNPVRAGEIVTFRATSEANPDRRISYECWDLDNDGDTEDCGNWTQHAFHEPGSYTVGLRVRDNEDGETWVRRTVEVVLKEVPPKPSLSLIVDRGEVWAGDVLTVSGRLTVPNGPVGGIQVTVSARARGPFGKSDAVKVRTAADGSYAARVRIHQNSAVTATTHAPQNAGASVPVFAEWKASFGWRLRNRRTIESGFVAYGPTPPFLSAHRAYFYYARQGQRRARLVARGRIFRTRFKQRPAAFVRFRVRRARRSDIVAMCIPEPEDDHFGYWEPSFRRCPRSLRM